MRRRLFLALFSVPGLAFAQAAKPEKTAEKKPDPSLTQIEDKPGLPRVLLIGDSISMGYTISTRELLAGVANVHRIPTNGGSTRDGLAKLDAWLGKGKWDVIHFNWGLHDLKHFKDGKMDLSGPQVTPVDQYEKNLKELVSKLKGAGAKLIWAATTPVPEGANGRVAKDELEYNKAALRVMTEVGVGVNDLHALVAPQLAKFQRPKDVHFNKEGYEALAVKVAAEIKKALGK